jgi:hypothetical protein
MKCPENLPRNTRQVPEGWDNLTTVAAEALDDNQQQAAAAVIPVYRAVRELEDKPLIKQYYYGLGQSLQYFATQLEDPTIQQSVVEQAAERLATLPYHHESQEPGVCIRDIDVYTISSPLLILARKAIEQMAPPEQLALRTLNIEAARRREQSYIDPEEVILDKTSLEIEIRNAAVAGITIVLKHGLVLRARAEGKDTETIRDIIPPNSLRAMMPDKTMRGFAGIRLDELLDDNCRHELIALNERNEILFQHDKLGQPSNTPLPVHRKPLTNERLTCPALQVEGLIPRMVDTVADIIIAAELLYP